MWRKNRKQRDQRIKRQQKENQYNFVDQIKIECKNQNYNCLIEQERQLQLQYHKQINL